MNSFSPHIVVKEHLKAEIVHHYDIRREELVTSIANRFAFHLGGREFQIEVPLNGRLKTIASRFRLARRALRIDKSNVVLTGDRTSAIIYYQGRIHRYDLETRELRATTAFEHARNALHGGILSLGDRRLYVGDYHLVPDVPMNIWMSQDGGDSWECVHRFPPGKVFHVHGIYFDPFEKALWVTTGDFDGQCHLLRTDPDFAHVEVLGDATQKWRSVSLLFTPEAVIWGMDSPLEPSYVMRYDRQSGRLTRGQPLPGPVWYTKHLSDGVTMLQTSCERGPGSQTRRAHLFVSTDLDRWIEAASFQKDSWNHRIFKHGVLLFAEGTQDTSSFALSGEALRGFDGRSAIYALSNGSV